MLNWFEWNDVKCTTKGIHVSKLPPITIPKERAKFTPVPGRSGDLTELEGDDVYDDQVLSAECYLANTNNIDTVTAYLKGGGKVTFANRQDGFYKARIVNQIPFDRILQGYPYTEFTVQFRCKPFFYLNSGTASQTISRSGNFLNNPGCVNSLPVISLTGSGDITLMIGQQIIELTDVSGTITIDSEREETYNANRSCNENMSGEYPVLVPGNNAITWDGSVTSVSIVPNWRTL